MGTILTNAILVDLDPPNVESASLRFDGGKIVARGNVSPQAGDEIIDCHGAVVLAGLVNGHTHLYSALAVGMPAPPRTPRNFLEILELIWWRLDVALDLGSIETSARIGAIEALSCGTTTLIDHHASPNGIENSLDAIEHGLDEIGIRGVLCYEVTDRQGHSGAVAGIQENRRYLEKCAARTDGKFAGLIGAHASFTLAPQTLLDLSTLARRFKTGVHIHVAEDACDELACRHADHRGPTLIDRLARGGMLNANSIFSHGIHLDDEAIARINSIGLTMAHNPRSNMNNAVGYAPIGKFKVPIMLGTDGIGADMFAEARAAWFKSRDASTQTGANISPNQVLKMLANSAQRASQALGVTIGKLQVGACADVVVTDYVPFSPLDSSTLAGHFIFAMSSKNVRDVMVGGKWKMRDRKILSLDAPAARRDAVAIAKALWDRMPADAFKSQFTPSDENMG